MTEETETLAMEEQGLAPQDEATQLLPRVSNVTQTFEFRVLKGPTFEKSN